LEEADMRYLTGVSLMAIRRSNGKEIDYPDGKTQLEEGDKLLVVGADGEIAALNEFAQGKVAVPGDNRACQWVTISQNCPVLGKTIADLDIHQKFCVEIQSMRREGRFIRLPGNNTDLQNHDQLLLCGSLKAIEELRDFLAPALVPLGMPIMKIEKTEVL
jgi:monovalent cation:H+ antiporter-2, CPA2 family